MQDQPLNLNQRERILSQDEEEAINERSTTSNNY